jgi:anti-sigma factor RsiW
MNQDPLELELREKFWRRPLTVAEQAQLDVWLAAHPEVRPDWEADAALGAALAKMPERRVASNFTARVLAEIEREDLAAAGAREKNWFGWLGSLGWVPRAAAVIVVLAAMLAGFAAHRHQQEALKARALSSFAAAADATPLPSPEIFENFDVINLLPPLPSADTELLAVLQ